MYGCFVALVAALEPESRSESWIFISTHLAAVRRFRSHTVLSHSHRSLTFNELPLYCNCTSIVLLNLYKWFCTTCLHPTSIIHYTYIHIQKHSLLILMVVSDCFNFFSLFIYFKGFTIVTSNFCIIAIYIVLLMK